MKKDLSFEEFKKGTRFMQAEYHDFWHILWDKKDTLEKGADNSTHNKEFFKTKEEALKDAYRMYKDNPMMTKYKKR